MLYSVGKDSAVLLHLARKAFYPSPPPFPLLHVDTRWKFQAMYDFRDYMAKESGMELLVHINPEGIEKNINPFDHGSALHTDIMKTQSLKMALDHYKFDVAFGGARRDEEKSRAKERIFSFRTSTHGWDAKNQRPELWNQYNGRKHPGESIRVFPISNWTELDIWQYIYREQIPIVPLYFAQERPVVERDGMIMMVDDDRLPLFENEEIQTKKIRFRTLGCYPLTGAIESDADKPRFYCFRTVNAKTSERQGRAIDSDSNASMEKKKRRVISNERNQSKERAQTSTERVNAYLAEQASLDTLRFITCGSVDDGKSTLIGRMLYEAQLIFEDQVASLKSDSKKVGTQGRYRFCPLGRWPSSRKESKASPLMLLIVSSQQIAENLLLPIRLGMSNTPETW